MPTITALHAENVKRLTAVQLAPPPTGAVVIGGQNGQGKSSLLDSILYALAGKGAMPEQPVRAGAESADIQITINTTPPLVVRRKIKPDGKATLEIRQQAAGGLELKVSSPQKVLDALIGTVAFDPLAFTRLRPQDQVETLKRLVGVDTIDLDSDLELLLDERKEQKRQLASDEASVVALPHYPEIPEDAVPPDTEDLVEKIKSADAHNETVRAHHRQLDEARGSLQKSDDDIADLKRRLDEAMRVRDDRAERLRLLESAGPIALIDVSQLLDESQRREELASKISANTWRRERLEAVETQRQQIDILTERIEALREHRIDLMASARWPVAGLSFGESGVTFHGLPFDQCSSAEQLRIGAAIGLSQNPQLKLMLIRDGSLLDEDNLAFLHELALEHAAQVFVERVGKGEECTVIIEDGTVLGASVEDRSLAQATA